MNEFLSKLSGDPNALFGMLFNLLIIAAVGGLWLMWARNMKRQKHVETILATTSAQLEEATRHLESALQEIQRLHGQRDSEATGEPAPRSEATTFPARAYRQAQGATATRETAQATIPAAAATTGDEATPPPPSEPAKRPSKSATGDAVNDAEQILRLHRLGKTAEQIAAHTQMPLARINLLLRLHEQRSSGVKAAR